MFKIYPASTEEDRRAACLAVGVRERDGALIYQMKEEDGTLIGMSQFDIGGGVGRLYDLREPSGKSDFEAMFILGRQTLNFIDLCENHICVADRDAGDERLLGCIGFKETAEGLRADLNGMFDGHCDGNPVDLGEK